MIKYLFGKSKDVTTRKHKDHPKVNDVSWLLSSRITTIRQTGRKAARLNSTHDAMDSTT
jgi:hypothetical protein